MSSTTSPAPRAYANPFLWVPSSYLAMGLIYVTVSGVANIMFKNMGMTDAEAARWSSLFVFPYVIKPLWAPALEIYKTKRFFVLLMQTLLVGGGARDRPRAQGAGHRLDADPRAARPRRRRSAPRRTSRATAST